MIYKRERISAKIKKGQIRNKTDLSFFVALSVQFSNLFIMDLKRLANIVA